jgi:uncharacterized protein (TIGR02611 family)
MRGFSNLGLAALVERRGMIKRAKENWQCFKQSKPGHRFQDHHRRCQRAYRSRSYFRGLFGIAWGLLVVVGGIVAVPAPGPGWLIILLGLGVIAGESLLFARWIDRAELGLRRFARSVAGVWTTSPILVKVLISLAVLACATALVHGMYGAIFGN